MKLYIFDQNIINGNCRLRNPEISILKSKFTEEEKDARDFM